MTQEDRKLLIKDLCSRSYYKVKVSSIYNNEEYEGTLCAIYPEDNRIIVDNLNKPCYYPNQTCGGFIIDEHKVKPYLFPMSSMTEEQKNQLKEIWDADMNKALDYAISGEEGLSDLFQLSAAEKIINWLNKYYFDYRGLIPKGLALDATGKNIY